MLTGNVVFRARPLLDDDDDVSHKTLEGLNDCMGVVVSWM